MQSAARITKPAPHGSGIAPGQQLLLHNVSWDAYQKIGAALADRPALRLTFDRGNLEIMTTSFEHEWRKCLLGRFIAVLSEECGVSIRAAGSTTFKKKGLKRGLEGDQTYYTKSREKVRGKKRLVMGRDPSPDLALEIDVTRSSVSRMSIYSRLKVEEVWRYDGQTIRIFLLDGKGEYQEVAESPTFPGIPIQELVRFLHMAEEADDDNDVIRQFRAWVRKHLPKKRKKSK